MESSIVLISPNGGTVRFLYQDGHPCLELGSAEMTRASNVRWSKEEQKWQIWLVLEDGSEKQIGHGFKNRSDAVAAEIEWLNEQLEEQRSKVRVMWFDEVK